MPTNVLSPERPDSPALDLKLVNLIPPHMSLVFFFQAAAPVLVIRVSEFLSEYLCGPLQEEHLILQQPSVSLGRNPHIFISRCYGDSSSQ